ncbi:MAG: hypothetical protein K5868_08925 [Lachnospiraceae bacterium]|nr:hypothetical protein [Lachnospiraceae bacterium]
MARKRMFSFDVINSDRFLDLPLATRGLYFHLNCEADDDGFISSALRTLRAVDGTEEMLNELVNAEYLIKFDSGIYLVKHWLLHNCIQKDRYTPSIHTKERGQVNVVDRIYCLSSYTDCIQNGSNLYTQISIDKSREDKDREKPKRTKAQSFNNNKYDFDELEKKLLSIS